MVKTYSAAAVSLSCRTRSPLFSFGIGVDNPQCLPGGFSTTVSTEASLRGASVSLGGILVSWVVR